MAVTGHGIDDGLVDAMFASMAEFFALPPPVKLQAAPEDPSSPRGYSYVGATAQANAHGVATLADLVETFNAGLDPVPATDYYRGGGRVLHPEHLARDPRPTSRRCGTGTGRRCRGLTERIMGLMAEALGLDGGWFAPLIDRPMASITVNHYPALDHEPAEGTSSAAAPTPITARSRCWPPMACPGYSSATPTGRGRPRIPCPVGST